MTEEYNAKWVQIILDALAKYGHPISLPEIRILLVKDGYGPSLRDLEYALIHLEASGEIIRDYCRGIKTWAIARKPEPILQSIHGRGLKDDVTRCLLDLIKKADQQDDKRCVAVLEHAISQLYSDEKI